MKTSDELLFFGLSKAKKDTSYDHARITQITQRLESSDNLVSVYTSSNRIVAEGVLSSCKVHDDPSEYVVPILGFISDYVSESLPQWLYDMTKQFGVQTLYYKVARWL